MSRAAVAAELQRVIADLQGLCKRGERLAEASGGLVDAKHFRAAMSGAILAAGDLDAKGLLTAPVEASDR
jgi:hypothetical protein